jgi:hypothetical protein
MRIVIVMWQLKAPFYLAPQSGKLRLCTSVAFAQLSNLLLFLFDFIDKNCISQERFAC